MPDKKNIIFTLLFFLCFLPANHLAATSVEREINVFTAASLTDAMEETAMVFEKQYGIKVNLNLAGSNTLRLQIERGMPCDVYISADTHNVDRLIQQRLVEPQGKRVLLTNRLVVISQKENKRQFKNMDELIVHVRDYLSLADPQTVPAGIYAKEALTNAGLWPHLKDRIAPAMDVRAALAQVEMGNIDYGIVYMTDAYISDKVYYPVYLIPEKYHSRIEYVACVIKDRDNIQKGNLFFEFLQRMEIKNIFQKYGFTTL